MCRLVNGKFGDANINVLQTSIGQLTSSTVVYVIGSGDAFSVSSSRQLLQSSFDNVTGFVTPDFAVAKPGAVTLSAFAGQVTAAINGDSAAFQVSMHVESYHLIYAI